MAVSFRLLGLNNSLGKNFYMIQDLRSTVPMQIISDEDVKLLAIYTSGVVDSAGNLVQIDSTGNLVCSVPVVDETEEYEEDTEDYDVDYEDDYDDIDYSDNTESVEEELDYDSDDGEDEYDISYTDEDTYDVYEDDFDDYDEYETEEETAVTKLYALLNEEQIKVLKQYYLWYSQRVFENKTFDPTLGIKNQARLQKKLNDLNIIRNTGGLWHYAGFIDVGRKGADYCTLGHPLRYVHLAWDVTASSIETAFFGDDYNKDIEDALNSNNCVKFGVKCISDFFEADQDCMHALLAAQRQTLQDMQILYDYYKDGIHKPGVLDTTEFDEIEKLVNAVLVKEMKLAMVYAGKKAEYDKLTVIPAALCTSLQKFKKVGLIPPKSMVQLIRDYIMGWSTHKFITTTTGSLSPYPFDMTKIWRSTKALFGEDITSYLQTIPDPNRIEYSYISYKANKFANGVSAWLRTYLCYEICGLYKFTANQGAKDEGGASKRAKELLKTLYSRVKYCGFHRDLDLYKYENIKGVLLLLAESMKLFKDNKLSEFEICDVNPDKNELGYYHQLVTEFVYYDKRHNGINSAESAISRQDKLNFDDYDRFCRYKWAKEPTLDAMKTQFEYLKEKAISYKKAIELASLNLANDKLAKLNKQIDEEKERLAREAEERARLEAEEAEKAAKKAEEEAKKAEEMEKKAQEIAQISDENERIYQYLINYSDKVTSFVDANSKFNFAGKVFATIKKSGKQPSEKQMVYLRDLYNAITGENLQGVAPQKVELSSRKDLEEAIDYCLGLGSKTGFEDRTLSILSSIKRFGKISDRQMKYAEQALEYFNKSKEV